MDLTFDEDRVTLRGLIPQHSMSEIVDEWEDSFYYTDVPVTTYGKWTNTRPSWLNALLNCR